MQTCISPISPHDYLLIINIKTLFKFGKEWSMFHVEKGLLKKEKKNVLKQLFSV
jgi:hypothetical protein